MLLRGFKSLRCRFQTKDPSELRKARDGERNGETHDQRRAAGQQVSGHFSRQDRVDSTGQHRVQRQLEVERRQKESLE
ncbi:hypothetical protein PAMP_014623 [Pampus punctatissimus]